MTTFKKTMIEISSLNNLSIHLDRLIKGRLWLKVIIGIVLGAGLGLIINPSTGIISSKLSGELANWLDLPGQVFLRLVQMIMIPLIFASIITGIVSNSSDTIKSFGLKLLLYFLFTTAVSIIIGLVLTVIIKPGKYIYWEDSQAVAINKLIWERQLRLLKIFQQLFLTLFRIIH